MMEFLLDDEVFSPNSKDMQVPVMWNSQDPQDAFAEFLDPCHPSLQAIGDLYDWEPSGDLDRISMAVYRLASVHQTTITHLSQNQIVDCMKRMDTATTIIDKIDVIKEFFPSVTDVKCCDHDVRIRISNTNQWVSHKDMFGVAVDVENIFEYHTGEVHILNQHHPYAKDSTLTLVMTHLPTLSGTPVRSFIQLDELFFATNAKTTKAVKGMPSVLTMEKAIGRSVLQNKALMDEKVANIAYTLLRQNMSQHTESTTMFTLFKQVNARVSVSDGTPRHKWEWILQLFDGIYSMSPYLATKAWSIFSIAVCTKSSFIISCVKVGPLNNKYPSRGVTIDTIDKTLFNVRGSLFIRNLLFEHKKVPQRRNWHRYMVRSLVVSVFAKYRHGLGISQRYAGRVTGTIDLDIWAPFKLLHKTKVAKYIEDHKDDPEQSIKRARVTKKSQSTTTRSVLVPLDGRVVIQNSQVI
jgi:hypothetical protein